MTDLVKCRLCGEQLYDDPVNLAYHASTHAAADRLKAGEVLDSECAYLLHSRPRADRCARWNLRARRATVEDARLERQRLEASSAAYEFRIVRVTRKVEVVE